MTYFFLVVVLVYGGMQAYVAAKAAAAFGLAGPARWALFGWAALMTVAPLFVRQLERCDCYILTLVLAWAVFLWMGFSFLFFCLGLAFDALGGLARLVRGPWLDSTVSFRLVAASALALSLYGVAEAWRPQVERVEIRSAKLPPEVAGLRIVQISDAHLGVMIGPRRLARILEEVRRLEPDIVLATGDIVDGQAAHLEGLAPLLAELKPRLGKYAVSGNHEFYVGLDHALDFFARAGFKVLRGEAVEVVPGVVLAGVDDPGRGGPGVANPRRNGMTDEASLLAHQVPGRFVILLKHQPVVQPAAQGGFDLQLSGHVHGGQIFPFGLLVRLVHPVATGLTPLAGGGALYVNRGAGTWGPPMRLLAPPEVTLFELRPQ